MRTLSLAVLLAVALVPAVHAQDPADPIVHDIRLMIDGAAASSVDIIDDHGKVFTYELDLQDPDFGGEILLAEVGIVTPNGRIVLRPEHVSTTDGIETWRGVHPVDDVRLTVGTHAVDLKVFDRNGGQTFCDIVDGEGTCDGGPTVDALQVTWDAQTSHALSLGLLDVTASNGAYPDQILGPTDKIRLDVGLGTTDGATPWALQHVRFTNAHGDVVTPAKSLRVPYVIGPQDLQQGAQDLTITATDRGGRTATITVHVDVDTLAPKVDVTLPAVTYDNVTFQARLDVADANDYTATLSLDDVQIAQEGGPGKLLEPFSFTRTTLGTGNLLVRVVDALGNQYLQQVNVTTVNATTPGAIAKACAGRGIPLVYVSTDYVFDGSGDRPWQPDDPTGPLGAYGRTKLEGEEAVRAAQGPHAILRTSWVVSAHGANFVKTMLRLGAERDRLTIVADQVGGPTPAADLAAACLAVARGLAAGGPSGVWHFAGAPDVSWADFAREIFAQAGMTCEVADIPSSDYPTPAARPMNSRLDCSALETDFGVTRPDWRAGLRAILKELGAV